MEFFCDARYILLPTSHHARQKRLLFYIDDRMVLDLVTPLDYDASDHLFPVDLNRFRGKIIRVECDPDMPLLPFSQAEKPDLDYSGKYRPLAHFTTRRGWINDPNGLTFLDGQYLLYYQHNPAATTWENMHWGSAVSTDLIHWEERGDVLFPDENGTIFSGCAIVDKRNVSGLKQGEQAVILYFYTCAGNTSASSRGKAFTQNLAYSTDGGKTLIKYPSPVIPHIAGENRDPKVIYYPPDNCYILALYLEKDQFALFRSENLLNWHEIQRLTLPGDGECPDFYPLCVDGDPEDIRWVFSAASDRYLIGRFDGRTFTPEGTPQRLNRGNGSYAAQSWSDLPDGRRIRTAFSTMVIPGMPFGSFLVIPQEMSLKRIGGSPKLCAWPVRELDTLRTSCQRFQDRNLSEGQPFRVSADSKACDLTLTITCPGSFRISLFGLDVDYDNVRGLLRCLDREAAVTPGKERVTLRLLYDTVAAEIFAEEGSVYLGMAHILDNNLSTLTIASSQARIEVLEIASLCAFYS